MSRPKLIDVPLHQDDRGSVYCPMDRLNEVGIKRTYVVENHTRGQVRAWHGHRRATTVMHVVRGACKLAALNMDDHEDLVFFTASERQPSLFYVPPGFYNGALSLTDNTKILVYSTLSFDEVKSDDHRLGWNAIPDVWELKNR